MPQDINAPQVPQVPQDEPQAVEGQTAPSYEGGYAPQMPRSPQFAQEPTSVPDPDILVEQINQAKEMLGLTRLEQELAYKDNVAEIISKYPEISKTTLEQELAKLEESDADMAKQIKTSRAGMEMFAKGIKVTINPDKKADEITKDSDSSAQQTDNDPVLEKVKKGVADKYSLGSYLNSL